MKLHHLLPLLSSVAIASRVMAQSPPRLVSLPMEPHPGILSSIPLGALPSDQPIHLTVAVPFRDPDGAQHFVDAVSDPNSPTYRHFLTPQQVGARFGYSPATLKKVTDYLAAQGLTVETVAPNGLAIMMHGTVAEADAAFHTSLEAFQSSDPQYAIGPSLFAFTATPSVPAEIAPYIGYVSGLETFTRPEARGNSITPAQLQAFYIVAPSFTLGLPGKGRTIGISNFDGYRLANLQTTYPHWNLPTPSGGIGHNVTIEVPLFDNSGANGPAKGEGDIDIQCALNMAPLSNLIIYDAGSGSNDLIGVLGLESVDNKADIITESYGWSSTSTSFYTAAHNEHVSLSAQGITYLAASGDKGTSSLGGRPYPDIDPEVLIVGGTTTNTNGSGALVSQTGWSGSGGGWSNVALPWSTLPAWQHGIGVPTNINARLSPDVALNADNNTPDWTYLQAGEANRTTNGWYYNGGTSYAAPTFAGCLADAEAEIIHYGGLASGAHRFGRIAPLLYSFDGNASIFTDILSGSNGTLPNGQTSNCTFGWDFVTGWGVMNFGEFAKSQSLQAIAYSVTPATVTGGTQITGTVTLSGAAPTGGILVNLSSNSGAVLGNGSFVMPAGSSRANFQLNTVGWVGNTTVTLGATTLGWQTTTTSVNIERANLSSISVSPNPETGGSSATGTVTLNGPAGSAGALVTLSSSNSSVAQVPATVLVPSGRTTQTFTIMTKPVSLNTALTIKGTYGVSASASFTVNRANLSSFTISPTTVTGGGTVTGTVTLNGPAGPSGVPVILGSTNGTVAPVPFSITVPANKTSAQFTFTTKKVSSTTAVTLSAFAGDTATAKLSVRP